MNGLNSRTFVLRGSVEGVEDRIFYKARMVQGETDLYMILTWTLDTMREANEPAMDAMLDSFQEL